MLRIHVPNFAELKVEQPPDVGRHPLQKGMPGKQYFVWFFLQVKNSVIMVQSYTSPEIPNQGQRG